MYRSLIETQDQYIANGHLLDVIRQVSCFGLGLVQLDIRQESSRHSDALDAITKYLGLGSYMSAPRPVSLMAGRVLTAVLHLLPLLRPFGSSNVSLPLFFMFFSPFDILRVQFTPGQGYARTSGADSAFRNSSLQLEFPGLFLNLLV